MAAFLSYSRGVLHTPFQERIILEKHKDNLYFDSQICKEAALADIDKEKIIPNISFFPFFPFQR